MTSKDEESLEEDCMNCLMPYFMLIMFILLSASSSFQWIEYAIITNIITDFYSIPSVFVNWTSVIYMATYILFVVPASWFLNKYGLRNSLLIGAGGNCIGALIKIASTKPDLFWVSFLGQTIVGSSQVFILGIPPRLAAVWFDANKVSTACAAGVFGNQLGIAIGFLLPPLIVVKGTKDVVASGLDNLFLISAIANSLVLVCIFVFFSDAPSQSKGTMNIRQKKEHSDYFASLKELSKNINFVLLFLTYGINVGVFYAISTFLDQIISKYYQDQDASVGVIGLLIVVAGMFGSVACGVVLDKFHLFRATTLVVYAFSFLGTVLFTVALVYTPIYSIFALAIFLGFFMTGYLPIGFELAVELTYPIPEGTTSGLLNLSAQIFGVIIITGMGQVFNSIGPLTCNIVLSGFLLLGLALTALIKSDLRRQKAQETYQCEEGV